jgi:23S rRNA pseudouridine2605 synthase
MRLNKYIAEATGKSRREADELIQRGRVSVIASEATQSSNNLSGSRRYARDDKAIVAHLGRQVADGDVVLVDGRELRPSAKYLTIILNKPVGYLSSRRSQGGDPTVYDLLPPEYKRLKTAGRLDKDSSGLMILSSDGDLIQRLTHPRYAKVKIYEVELDKPLAPLHQQMISGIGIDLPDGKSSLTLQESSGPSRTFWVVTMHEGRNRQIRRTFSALGYNVKKLHRTQLGPYHLDDLKSGNFRKISVESKQHEKH